MKYYTDKYNDLIDELTVELTILIKNKGVDSEFMSEKCLPIDIDANQHFSEIVYWNDKLILLNDDGYHYDFSLLGEGDEFFLRVDAIINNYS